MKPTTAATLSPAETNLRAAADAVRAALAKVESATDAIRQGTEQRDALTAEIERERVSINTDDDDALQKLAAKQTKLEILKARIPNDEVLPPLVRALRELLQTIPNPLSAFLAPVMEQLVAKLDGELVNHIPDPGARLQAVQGNPAVHRLRNTMASFWKVFEAVNHPAETARQVLSEIDAILEGQKSWLASA